MAAEDSQVQVVAEALMMTMGISMEAALNMAREEAASSATALAAHEAALAADEETALAVEPVEVWEVNTDDESPSGLPWSGMPVKIKTEPGEAPPTPQQAAAPTPPGSSTPKAAPTPQQPGSSSDVAAQLPTPKAASAAETPFAPPPTALQGMPVPIRPVLPAAVKAQAIAATQSFHGRMAPSPTAVPSEAASAAETPLAPPALPAAAQKFQGKRMAITELVPEAERQDLLQVSSWQDIDRPTRQRLVKRFDRAELPVAAATEWAAAKADRSGRRTLTFLQLYLRDPSFGSFTLHCTQWNWQVLLILA